MARSPGSDDEVGMTDAADRLRRRVLWAMPSGLYVVGSRSGDRCNLMTCNWVMQVATTPKLVAVGIETASVTRSLIEESGSFSVNLLARRDRSIVRRFVKPVRDVDLDDAGLLVSLQGEPVHEVTGGLPVLHAAVAWLTCSVTSTLAWDNDAAAAPASHVLVIGEVVEVGASEEFDNLGDDSDAGILSMSDTRMSYGG